MLLSQHRDGAAARALFTRALSFGPALVEVTTDRAPVYPRVLDELTPGARHILQRYANNVGAADHGRLTARLRPMRGLTRVQSASTIAAGHAFVQTLRRGHYELTAGLPSHDRVHTAFAERASSLRRPARGVAAESRRAHRINATERSTVPTAISPPELATPTWSAGSTAHAGWPPSNAGSPAPAAGQPPPRPCNNAWRQNPEEPCRRLNKPRRRGVPASEYGRPPPPSVSCVTR